jgi:hypothetical protein
VDTEKASLARLLRGFGSPLCHEMERGFRGEDFGNIPSTT